MDKVVPEVGREVIDRLGLDYIGLTINDIYDILEDIISGIAEARSSKPSIESLIKNIIRNKLLFYKAIAAKLAYRENLTLEQLEFVISYAPEVAGRAAPKLYHIAKRLGAEHIVDALRVLWVRYGRPTPFRCPRCGFQSLAPDLRCIVCGAEIDEDELKNSMGFERAIEELARESPVAALEVVSAGFVIYDGERLYPPSSRPLLSGRPVIELYVTSREKEVLEKIARERIKG